MKKILGLIVVLMLSMTMISGCDTRGGNSLGDLLYLMLTSFTYGCPSGYNSCGNGYCCPSYAPYYNTNDGLCYSTPHGWYYTCNEIIGSVVHTDNEILSSPKQGDAESSIMGVEAEKATKTPQNTGKQ